MRRPSTYRAAKTGNPTITMEQMLVAFQQQRSEDVRLSAYRMLTGQTAAADTPLDEMEIVTRQRVAQLMQFKDAHAVDAYCRAGRLTPVYFPGGKRVRGFTAASVRKLLNGEKEVA